MSVDATPLPSRIARPRLAIRLVELPDRALLGGLVILTAAVRFAVALLHTTPRFFPDEYIYPALAQSLLHGRLEIRGEPAHFPALLESIVTAPLWLAGGVELPFRLTQLLHAVLAAAAIIPIYAICRRLDLPRWQRFACAAITAVLPVFIYATYVSADALGTLVALAAIATGTAVIAAPARRREVLFLALAGLATFARVQYVVLLPAFALAALVICHWRPWRTVRCFPVVTASFAAAAACALALGPSRLLGYYDGLLDTGIAPLAMARWAGTDLVLLACAGGLVLAPAAAVGLAWGIARPRSRVEHAFAALSGSFLLLTLLAAVIYNTNGSPRFQERYFMAVLPLLAPLACLGTQRLSARGPRLVLAGATLGLLAFIAGKPLPDYVQDNGDQDSPLLQGVVWLTWRLGTTPAGLGLAVLAAAVLLATAVGLVFSLTHRSSAFMLAAAALLLTLASLAAVGTDLTYANGAWKSALGRDARWIDNAKQGQVSVVLPRITLRWIVSEQLFWNRSLDRVLSLSDAVPPDAFQSMPVRIDSDGRAARARPTGQKADPVRGVRRQRATRRREADQPRGERLVVAASRHGPLRDAHGRSLSRRRAGLPGRGDQSLAPRHRAAHGSALSPPRRRQERSAGDDRRRQRHVASTVRPGPRAHATRVSPADDRPTHPRERPPAQGLERRERSGDHDGCSAVRRSRKRADACGGVPVSNTAVSLSPASRLRFRLRAHAVAVPAAALLVPLVILSAVLRFAAALQHTTPRLFPDEYIYAELARSLADGRLEIRGERAHFPALLEPLLTAPLWLPANVEASFRLTQALHAVVASLVAVPVYLIACRLALPAWQRLLAAGLSVALPSLLFSSYLTADVLGLTLALTAVYAGIVALQSAGNRAQLAFLVAAGLATFARVQYVVLLPAFAAAALSVSSWHPIVTVRRYLLTASFLALAAGCALLLGPGRILGYYHGILDLDVELGAMAHWARLDLMLLVYASGVALVPLALVGLVGGIATPLDDAERGFATLVGAVAGCLLVETVIYATGTNRFQERYLMALGPIVPLLFFTGSRHLAKRWSRLGVAGASLLLMLVAIREPLAGLASGDAAQDSPLLQSLLELERLAGESNGSLLVSLGAVALLLVAMVAAFRPRPWIALTALLALVALLATSVGAVSTDVQRSRGVRETLPEDLRFVDRAGVRDVPVLVSPLSYRPFVSSALFWNRSLTRLLLLKGAPGVDAFGADHVTVAADGAIHAGGEEMKGALLVDEYGSQAELDGASLVRRVRGASLWTSNRPFHLAMLTEGRYLDGWLTWPNADISVWPAPDHARVGTLCLDLRTRSGLPATVQLEARGFKQTVPLASGERKLVAIPVNATGKWTLRVGSDQAISAGDRLVSVHTERPRFVERSVGPQAAAARCR